MSTRNFCAKFLATYNIGPRPPPTTVGHGGAVGQGGAVGHGGMVGYGGTRDIPRHGPATRRADRLVSYKLLNTYYLSSCKKVNETVNALLFQYWPSAVIKIGLRVKR